MVRAIDWVSKPSFYIWLYDLLKAFVKPTQNHERSLYSLIHNFPKLRVKMTSVAEAVLKLCDIALGFPLYFLVMVLSGSIDNQTTKQETNWTWFQGLLVHPPRVAGPCTKTRMRMETLRVNSLVLLKPADDREHCPIIIKHWHCNWCIRVDSTNISFLLDIWLQKGKGMFLGGN